MPGVYREKTVANAFMAINQRLRAIETQQQSTYSNGKGQPIINTGYIPGSVPAEYGFQFVNPSLTGTGGSGNLNGQIAFFGEDANGNVGLYYYNGSGTKISQYDATGLHFYNGTTEVTRLDAEGFHSYDSSGHEVTRIDQTGLHVYDDSGTEQVAGGLVNPSPAVYGLAVLPPGGGNLQLVSGYASVSPPDVIGTSASSWTAFSTPNSVTVEIGPSGKAQVVIAGELSSSGAGVQPFASVGVDGAAPSGASPYMSADSSAGSIIVTGSGSTIITGLSAGSHTFQLQYERSGTGTASFTGMQLAVQPL